MYIVLISTIQTPLMVTSWVIQSFLTFVSMDIILKCDHSIAADRLSSTLQLFVFQFIKFINFGLGTVRSERVKKHISLKSFNKKYLRI